MSGEIERKLHRIARDALETLIELEAAETLDGRHEGLLVKHAALVEERGRLIAKVQAMEDALKASRIAADHWHSEAIEAEETNRKLREALKHPVSPDPSAEFERLMKASPHTR
jgi:predicted  nucleic acid-binding Zn-ribbon protein